MGLSSGQPPSRRLTGGRAVYRQRRRRCRGRLPVTFGALFHTWRYDWCSEDTIDDWAHAISTLHEGLRADLSDERIAIEAVANLWSGFGYQDAPTKVTRMFLNALEAGYLTALRDVRDGDLDEQTLEWRPELAEIR